MKILGFSKAPPFLFNNTNKIHRVRILPIPKPAGKEL